MANMYLTLEQTAEQLGLTSEQVQDLADQQRLPSYKDRGKTMFKKDEVDAFSAGGNAADTTGTGDGLDGLELIDEDPAGASGATVLAAGDSLSGGSDVVQLEAENLEVLDGDAGDTDDLVIELDDSNLSDPGGSGSPPLSAAPVIAESVPSGDSMIDGSPDVEGGTLDHTSVGGLSLMDDSGETSFDSVGGSDPDLSLDDTAMGTTADFASDASASGVGGLGDTGLSDTGLGGSGIGGDGDVREASGVSVFEAGEGDQADPMDQTAITSHGMSEEDLSLEAVGSGSGLLDLTRDSDDTSLGAELLEELYVPGGETGDSFSMGGASGIDLGGSATAGSMLAAGQASGIPIGTGSAAALSGSQGVVGSSLGGSALYGSGVPIGDAPAAGASVDAGRSALAGTTAYGFDYDPIGSGLAAGLLFGALVALVAGLVVVVTAMNDGQSLLVTAFIGDGQNTVWILTLALLVLVAVCAAVGVVLAKAGQR